MVNSRFSVAIHILSLIATAPDKNQLTSDYIAGSVNTNPVVIRRTISVLKKAGLVVSKPGVAGYELVDEPAEIPLLRVYEALGGTSNLFSIHDEPNPACTVGKQISGILENTYDSVWQAVREQLKALTLQSVLDQLQ